MIYLYVQPMCMARHSYLGKFRELKGTSLQVNLWNSRAEVWHQHSLTPVTHKRSDTKKLGTKSKGICLQEAAARSMHNFSLAQVLELDLGKEEVSCTPLTHYYIPEKSMDSRVSPAAIHYYTTAKKTQTNQLQPKYLNYILFQIQFLSFFPFQIALP